MRHWAILIAALVPSPAGAQSMFGPDNRVLWVAVLLFFVIGVVVPIVVAVISSRAAAKHRAEDLKRQDTVATLLAAANDIASAGAKVVVGKLDVITTMVDGSMTQALVNDHKSSVALLAMLEIVEAAGGHPSAERADQIAVLKARITELDRIIADRMRQVALAEDQTKQNVRVHLADREAAAADVKRVEGP
jgi:hypothetical protein